MAASRLEPPLHVPFVGPSDISEILDIWMLLQGDDDDLSEESLPHSVEQG